MSEPRATSLGIPESADPPLDQNSPVGDCEFGHGGKGILRVGAATLLALAAVISPGFTGSGFGVLVPLLFAACATAAALASPSGEERQQSLVGKIPLGFTVIAASVIIEAQVLAVVNVSALSTRLGAWIVWTISLVPIIVVAIRRGGRILLVKGDWPSGVAGAAMLGLGGAIVVALPMGFYTRLIGATTDFNRHLVFTKFLLDDGFLRYGPQPQDAYPRGVHALVGTLWQASGGARYSDAWLAMEATTWLMLGLLAMAMVTVAARTAQAAQLSQWLGQILVPITVGLAFMQGMWITRMFQYGFVTTILAGLCLAVAGSVCLGRGHGGTIQTVLGLAATALVVTHSWSLVSPTIFLALGVSLWFWVARTRPKATAMLAMAMGLLVVLAACVPPLIALVGGDVSASSRLGMVGLSGLAWPGLAWGVLLPLAGFAAFRARRTMRDWLVLWIVLCAGMAATSAAVFWATGLTWGDPGYYALKTLWISSVLVLPLGIAGAFGLIEAVYRKVAAIPARLPRLVAASLALAFLTLALAAGLGNMAGNRSQTLQLFHGPRGSQYQIPAADALESLELGNELRSRPVLIWGTAPIATVPEVASGAIRVADYSVREMIAWFNRDLPDGRTQSLDTLRTFGAENATQACEFLRLHPDALRITGPNPVTGANWLLEFGCPVGVVKPAEWIHLPVSPDWLSGGGASVGYPSYAEIAEITRQVRENLRQSQGSDPSPPAQTPQ